MRASRGLLVGVTETEHQTFAGKGPKDGKITEGSLLLSFIIDEEVSVVHRFGQGAMWYRLFALIYTSDEAFDTSFTINYPVKDVTPNLPFTIVAGNKDTLREQGLETYDIRQIPDLLAVRPIYRPELNLIKQNMSSYCIFVNYQQNTPGWHTAEALEECLERHRKLTQTDHQVEMQLKPAYLWYDEQQTPCKFAMIQLQTHHSDQERQVRNVFNAAGLKYTINKQIVTVHGSLEGLEEVRLQLLQQGIKLPMTPTEGATQLTIHQTTPAKACQGFQGL